MTAIIDFITGIADGVQAAIAFLLSIVEDTLFVVQITGNFVTKIPSFFDWLPAPVVAIIVSIFGVVVIYKILGREG